LPVIIEQKEATDAGDDSRLIRLVA
jgi:hypothetical protein